MVTAPRNMDMVTDKQPRNNMGIPSQISLVGRQRNQTAKIRVIKLVRRIVKAGLHGKARLAGI
jgi:ribosomal protein L7/L12